MQFKRKMVKPSLYGHFRHFVRDRLSSKAFPCHALWMDFLIFFEPKPRAIVSSLPPFDSAVFRVHHHTFPRGFADKSDCGRRSGRSELFGQMINQGQAWIDVLAERANQNAWHQEFRRERIRLNFQWTSVVVPHVGLSA